MGGAASGGNVTPAAEFNIWADPEAADIVFRRTRRLTMVGLDVTHQVLMAPAHAHRIRRTGNACGELAADLLDFAFERAAAAGGAGAPIHDAYAVVAVTDPELFGGTHNPVRGGTRRHAYTGDDGGRRPRPRPLQAGGALRAARGGWSVRHRADRHGRGGGRRVAMSPDRVVYSFVLGWVILIGIVLLLDWLGNPDRGSFRPKGDRPPRSFRIRRRQRRRKKLEDDAAVRATLRDAYGASSLRLSWTRALEDAVREADDRLVVPEGASPDDVLDVASEEVIGSIDYTAVVGDPLPNVAEHDPAVHASPAGVAWSVGGHPLAPTRTGATPSAATIRSRVWKNHAEGGWGDDNRARLQAGKPPRRRNPVTGKTERAKVDLATGRAFWPATPVDPFEEQR